MVAADFTLRWFPSSGPLKDACGLPFSTVVTPFATPSSPLTAPDGPAPSSQIARCGHCYAYINSLCRLTATGFHCSLCGRHTALKGPAATRYLRYPGIRDLLPELSGPCYEVLLEGEEGDGGDMQEGAPCVLALVDCSPGGGAEYGELVRAGLAAGLEGLPPGSRVGLVGFSDRISLVDLHGPSPCVRCLPLLESWPLVSTLEDVLPLEDLLAPLEVARAHLSQALDLLLPSAAATTAAAGYTPGAPPPPGGMQRDGRSPSPGPGNPSSPGTPNRPPLKPSRGFGPAIQSVLDYLRGVHTPALAPPVPGDPEDSPLLGPTRLLVFLSGAPDLGPGKTVSTAATGRRSNGGQAAGGGGGQGGEGGLLHHPHQDPAIKGFYDAAGLAAASLGAVVDLYVAASGYVGLASLEGLANSSGGALYLYPSAEEATLPQDVYRRLSTPLAGSCVLRIRTSRDLKLLRCYGRCYPDAKQEGLYHLPAADPTSTFVFDLDYTGASSQQLIQDAEQAAAAGGWTGEYGPMALQFAFQYDAVVAVRGGSRGAGSSSLTGLGSGGSSSGVGSYLGQQQQQQQGAVAPIPFRLLRKLRVCTLWVRQVPLPAEVYAGVNAEAVLTVLAHKITKAVRSQGVAEARLLLRDWLIIFASNYHRNSYMRASPQQLLQLPIDLEFEGEPALSRLPRLVFALLRSPLLSSTAAYHTDLTAYLHHLWGGLAPKELTRAVYPCLSAWSGPNELLVSELPLSKASLMDNVLVAAPAGADHQQQQAGSTHEAAASSQQQQQEGLPTSASFDSSAEPPAGILKSPSIADAAAAAAAAAAVAAAGMDASSSSKSVRFAPGSPLSKRQQGVARPVRLYFLDAFILLLVYYARGANEGVPLPPPQDSQLWGLIGRIRKERAVTPHVELIQAGEPGADLFASLLIDDPDEEPEGAGELEEGGGSSGPSPTGLQHFVDHIRAEVVTHLHG